MCGIAGLWLRHDAPVASAATLDAMVERLLHRGPDDHGTWVNRDGSVFLGHRRLAILDLSPLGHQPMVSEDGQPPRVI